MNFRWPVRVCTLMVVGAITIFVIAIIRSTQSEDAHAFRLLKGLLPAGNCLCRTSVNFECSACLECSKDASNMRSNKPDSKGSNSWKFTYGRDDKNEGLNEAQCAASFPGLFEDINRAVNLRRHEPITMEELDAVDVFGGSSLGMVRAKIHDGELYILASKFFGEDDDDDHRQKGIAILQSISRAIFALPDRRSLPNIEFAFSVEDYVSDATKPIWTLARRAEDRNLWLMPDFAFWSWRVKGTGPLSSLVAEVMDSEDHESNVEQIQKLVWRGRLSVLPKLRRDLVEAAEGKDWSDVRALQVEDHPLKPGSSANFLSAADQCKYMFIAHAEGRSYSGSLKYRQVCRSVVVSHKLQWIQHHHYLLIANGPQQNFVEVERDFSDLEERMQWLLGRPEEVERIANNSVTTFRERYLTPAAEACYWRALIRGWASVSFQSELYETLSGGRRRQRGARFETYALFKSSKQMAWRYDGR